MFLFIDAHGRLRSGWRFAVFGVLYMVVLLSVGSFAQVILIRAVDHIAGHNADAPLSYSLIIAHDLIFRGTLIAVALFVGWLCGRVFEALPFASLGIAPRHHWWRDLTFGILIGVATLGFAVGLAMLGGGFRFDGFWNNQASTSTHISTSLVIGTIFGAGVLFIVAATAEETLFRGYPLQTLMRSLPVPLAVLPTSLLFAYVHLGNPNVAAKFTFLNTLLAGLWLAVAYWRTQNLWLPLGLHFAWNWTQGALLGLPVSGITRVAPAPLLRAVDLGPAWLTGGDYGIEGGIGSTIALVVSTIYIHHKIRKDDESATASTER